MSSSEIQPEPRVGRSAGHENGSGSELPPARGGDNTLEEKKLRAFMRQKNIESTTSLVRTYNGPLLTGETERLLHKCLRIYSAKKEQCVSLDTVMEYVELCKITPRTDDDKELLGEVVPFLTGQIPEIGFADESVAEALHRSLLWTPPAVFQEDLTRLTVLADKLMASLHRTPRLTEANFHAHEATFMALHEVFVLMQRTAREKITMEEKKRFQSSLRAKRSSMGGSCKYYPVHYYFKLIEQSIQRLKLDEEPPPMFNAIHCLYVITCGILHISHAVKQIAMFDIDPSQLKALPGNLQELVADVDVAERQWYDLFLALCFAGRESVQDHQKLEIFEESYKTVEVAIWKMRRSEDGKALLFGLTQELRHLTLAPCSVEVRRSGSSKLFALAEAVSKNVWVRDKDIVKALLCCLHAIYSRGSDAAAALRSSQQLIESAKLKTANHAVRDWLGGKSLEEKLSDPVHASSEPTGRLFCEISRTFDHIPLHEAGKSVEQLKNRYRSDEFATVRFPCNTLFVNWELCVMKVPSLFDDESRMHVKDMVHHIVFYQIVEEKEESSEQIDPRRSKDDQTSERRVAMPIALEDLFKKRIVKEDNPVQAIRTILFHGKPGSGKTCISKFIGHVWATGQMFKEFKAVYVLPARELNNKEDIEGASKELVAFILRKCFPKERGSDTGLRAQVDDHLDLQTTLLIIDGWDEVDKKAEAILNEAKRRQCSVLWLMRPYNLRSMRKLTDLEVECLGFSDEQVDRYVKKELPSDSGQKLFDVLKSSASLWEVAHIPVMAHILCFLWKEGGEVTFGNGHRLSPASMYADMANYIWLRFLEKVGEEKARRKEVFATLEVIAFDALCEDRILINLNFVERREDSLNVKKVLRHSGFLLFKKEGLDYQFPHLTFQEYFAARWLAQSLKKASTSDEYQKALDFLREEKYLKRYRTTLMFLAQQLAERQGVDGLSELLSNLDEEPMEIIGLRHLLLKLHIIEAWLTGLEDKSKIEDCCACEPIASLIKASISLIWDTSTDYREFGKILGSLLRQCPVLFGAVPTMLDCLTNSTMVRNTVRHDVFGEVVRVAKHSPGHLERLVEEARRNIKSFNRWERYTGMEMLRELLDCAPQLSTDLLSLCEMVLLDETFRRQGISLQAVISVLPDRKNMFSELLPLFERTIANPNRFIRQAVMEAIGSFASATAEQCSRILLIIERGCEDRDEDVCREALRAMRRFVPEQTFLVVNLVPVVQRLACGENEEIRRETIKTIECVGRKSPQVWSMLPPICHSMCLAEEACVRRDATEMVGRLASYIPPLRSDLLPLIEKSCTDASAVVRVAGLRAIKLLATRSSENANDMLRIPAAGYVDENESVRRTAMEAISRLASASYLSEDIMSLVKRGCLDEDVHVRLWAVDALGRLSSVAPHLSEDILALLRERCIEVNHHVRQWSMEAVGHLASAAPDLAGDILPLVRLGCSDGDEYVRLWALKAISKLAEAAPQLAENVVPLLRDVAVSEDTHMMNRANEAMRAVSSATTAHLSTLLRGAPESECVTDRPAGSRQRSGNKATLEFEDTLREAIETMQPGKSHQAVRLLLYEAVTLEKSKRSGYNRVVLHSTDKRVVGEYPVEQFDHFVSSVAMFRNTFHGGLLNALREQTTKKPEKDRQFQ